GQRLSPEQVKWGKPIGDGVRAEHWRGAARWAVTVYRPYADDHRVLPRQDPPRALGAAGAEASAKAGQPPDATSPHRQTRAESSEVVLAYCRLGGCSR